MQIPVRIVLVDTSHPGNIGASARAMKTMGVADLALVRPRVFPSDEATARASGADDILARATVHETLADAIADCGFVVGASARLRSIEWPTVDPRTCAETVWREIYGNRVAIVLGPEQSGLTNEDLGRCQQLVHIPTQPGFSSLNVAMAVQVLCYELRMARRPRPVPDSRRADDDAEHERAGRTSSGDHIRAAPLATAAELESFHQHLERVLTDAGFLHPDHPRAMKLKLRRIFHRAALDQNEINILRGMLSALDPSKPRRRREK
ncbi:MAG: RNA methyltransferase [Gammaproteobacteria bacterium]|nr:RNA methyltransferase [Gammaproteobacteria bacterium]